jgi:hypothetical protein
MFGPFFLSCILKFVFCAAASEDSKFTSGLKSLGIGRAGSRGRPVAYPEYVIVNRPLDRIFAFNGYSIDDVVDNPIAK